MSKHLVITAAVRTAIGTFGGAVSGHSPSLRGALGVVEGLRRAGLPAAGVGHEVFGVVLTESKDADLARVQAIEAGIPIEVLAMTLNRLLGSGVQAIERA